MYEDVRERLGRKMQSWCDAAGVNARQRACLVEWYVNGAPTRAHLGRRLGISQQAASALLTRAQKLLFVVLADHYHPYRVGCVCDGCALHECREVIDCLRNAGAAAKRPTRAPEGQPGKDGKAWPLRGPIVTAEDLLECYRNLRVG